MKSLTDRKIENLLQKFVDNKMLTSDGKTFVINSLNPFPDTQATHVGLPDTTRELSVVYEITQSLSFGSGAVAGAFDFNVIVWPFDAVFTAQTVLANDNILTYPGLTGSNYGGVQVVNAATGTPCTVNSGGAFNVGILVPPAEYQIGKYRTIYGGFEITNTSADLYLGGMGAAWSMDTAVPDKSTWFINGVGAAGVLSGYQIPFPPPDYPTVTNMPNTIKLNGRDGCYSTFSYNNDDNKAMISTPSIPVIMRSQYPYLNAIIPSLTTSAALYTNGPFKMEPRRMTGYYGVGFAQQSTFELNVKWYVESFPDTTNPQILLLAKPSPCYDPFALHIVSEALQTLPVGVPVSENGTGEWFFNVLKEIAQKALPLIGAIPHPIAKAVGTIGAGLVNLLPEEKGTNATVLRPDQPYSTWESGNGQTVAVQSKKNKKKKKKVQPILLRQRPRAEEVVVNMGSNRRQRPSGDNRVPRF
jgi:hypothetical protein